MKKVWLVLIGLLPLLFGIAQNHAMMTVFYSVRAPYITISLVYLALWGLVGFLAYPLVRSVKLVSVLAHIPALGVLLLLLFQEIVLGHYWMNNIGLGTQLFYLPLISLAGRITFFTPHMSVMYIVAFILMCGAFFLGGHIRKKRIMQR
jgi:hypothetical protein